ncbi:argininosuccinate lyase [Gracilinema caldarium]|uniref:Argininosuccinate lyase n=1 Tax=Gracilinema caldarium (strain ATCC 51460 / DSM 7334 / H1) TaxID=744872 RepID=F8F1I9_GRAC1|nr:argininosuccinate lyase [Gracilinema caldarium]AEJ19042.1 Argininosuccinate lyase [Gracilinema caldarium DSM 7334]
MAQVLWSGRLEEKPDAEALAFESSIAVDSRLAQEDITGSRAHVAMLAKQGIIPAEAAQAIDTELGRISRELAEGKISIDQEAEDIHSFIEGLLTERLGDVGRMVHAGRSRNDQVAVDLRLYLKGVVPEIAEEIRATCQTLLDLAEQHLETLMPGYTHLQRAQPVSLAHHLVAWTAGLERDRGRFLDALTRLDECPLGSGALATSTLTLDRYETARGLGFPRPTVNSMDSVADRDFALELAGACAILATHLSRFCEDVVLWATEEFGFINLAEQWSTGSSIMPQKKNPDFAELIRGKTGRQIGNLVTLLTLLKGLPYAYDRDLQEDKEALFDALDTARATLRMFRPMMATAQFRKDRMEAACVGGFLEATDVAEYLVRKGLPFRKAHEVAAQVVRDCGAAGQRSIAERTLEELRSRSELFDADLYEVIRPGTALRNRSRSGGPAPEAVQAQIAELRRRLEK